MKPLKLPIRFKFDLDKLIASLAYFAQNGVHDLTKLKACKLLYYADKNHLIKYGRPILGDVYTRLHYGPVPSMSLNIMSEMINKDEVDLKDDEGTNNHKFLEQIKIHRKSFGRGHPVFMLKKDPNLECLSESEIESLKEVIQRYGGESASKLVDSTHKEAPWLQSQPYTQIDYRLFFVDEPEAKPEAQAYMEEMQENIELVLGLE